MGDGISNQTRRAMRNDPDLDKGLYDTPVPPATLSNGLRKKYYTPTVKTPQQTEQEKAASDASYQKYKNQPKPGKYRY